MTPFSQSNSSSATVPPNETLDKVGAAASFLCAVHCALLPLVVTLLPMVGLAFLAEGWVEWLLLGTSAALGVGSLCLGFRQHRSRRAFVVLSVGLALLLAGRLLETSSDTTLGVVFVVAGGLAVAASHLFNRALCRACVRCKHE